MQKFLILFEQSNNNFEYSNGHELNHTNFPMLTGITYKSKQHLFELRLAWNYKYQKDYYISRNQLEQINTPPIYTTLSYKFILDTTIGAEKKWESGQTEIITRKLGATGKLNGVYFGVGLSSAFWLSNSSYNSMNRPYIEKYSTSILPDFTLGYYWHEPDINLAFGYRGFGSSTNSYGVIQDVKRKSVLVEVTKTYLITMDLYLSLDQYLVMSILYSRSHLKV